MTLDEYTDIAGLIQALEREGKVTRTFRRLDHGRQETVLRAIFDEALESGPRSLNIKRVAGRAGVAVGSLYQYFGSREGLLDFTIELVVRATRAGFDQYRPYLAALPLREGLAAYGAGALEWAGQTAGFSHFFARAAYSGDPELAGRLVEPIAAALREMVAEMLAAAQARGELRPGVDLEAAARALHGMLIALYDPVLLPYLNAYFQASAPGCPPERTLSAAHDLILRGLLSGDPPV
jgi:AcrR family transcriptional regulator